MSRAGRVIGSVKMLPRKAERLYRHMHEQWGFSNLALLMLLLTVPVTIGAVLAEALVFVSGSLQVLPAVCAD